MATMLYVVHTNPHGTLPLAAREGLHAAIELRDGLGDATLVVGLVGAGATEAAHALAGCGAERFLAVDGPEFSVSRYASDAQALTELFERVSPSYVLAPATARWARVVPGVAGRCQGRIDTQVSGLTVNDGIVQVERWYYRQRIKATLSRDTRPWFLLLATGAFPAWKGEAGQATVEAVSVDLSDQQRRTQVQGTCTASTDAQTIRPEAELLLVAGAGWTKKQADGQTHVAEAEPIILEFLNKTHASLGSSKSLVDQDTEGQPVMRFLSHLNQIGQTGSTPRHPKGLATCCHGEEPHVVGWRFIGQRRAINTDAGCGWSQGKADVLYVADAFQVLAKVNALLS